MTNPVSAPGVRKKKVANNVATDSTGSKLKYTVPSGATATLTNATYENNGGGESVDGIYHPSAGGGIFYADGVAATEKIEEPGIQMEAGDDFDWQVASAGACGDNADFYIGIIEEI